MKRQHYRVFFNRRGAPQKDAWSIDTGEGTERRHFRSIVIEVPAVSVYNGQDPDWRNPIAWFAVYGVLEIAENGIDARIQGTRKRSHDSNKNASVRRRIRTRAGRVSA